MLVEYVNASMKHMKRNKLLFIYYYYYSKHVNTSLTILRVPRPRPRPRPEIHDPFMVERYNSHRDLISSKSNKNNKIFLQVDLNSAEQRQSFSKMTMNQGIDPLIKPRSRPHRTKTMDLDYFGTGDHIINQTHQNWNWNNKVELETESGSSRHGIPNQTAGEGGGTAP